jgi:hypothetical protein
MIMNQQLTVVCLVVGAAACGGKKQDGSSGGGATTAAAPIDVAGVNALVPAELKDKVVFEQRDLVEKRGRHKTTFTLAAPKGWTQKMDAFASLKPDRDDLGFMTELEVGTNCDGECTAKDWAASVEKVYANYLQGNVLKDVKGDHTRTIIAEQGTMTLVVTARWEDGANQYTSCGATLERQAKDLAPAVEKTCQAVSVRED